MFICLDNNFFLFVAVSDFITTISALSSRSEDWATIWLGLATGLYYLGLIGAIANRTNLLHTVMAFELMYLGAITSFVVQGSLTYEVQGGIYGLILLIFAACESAVGLGVLVATYRLKDSVEWFTFEGVGG
jgi:NADH:ubiquinone oxidoreductase subunit K